MYILVIHFLVGPTYFLNTSDIILCGGQVALALDQDLNCLDSFKNIINISRTGLSLISSDPSRVCLCTTTEVPNCTILFDSISKPIFPGYAVFLTAIV